MGTDSPSLPYVNFTEDHAISVQAILEGEFSGVTVNRVSRSC